MTRWDWTWEDRSNTARTPMVDPEAAADGHETGSLPDGSLPAPGNSPPPEGGLSHVFRRRRAGAGLALIAIVVLLVGALSSHKGSGQARAPSAKSRLAKLTPSQADL